MCFIISHTCSQTCMSTIPTNQGPTGQNTNLYCSWWSEILYWDQHSGQQLWQVVTPRILLVSMDNMKKLTGIWINKQPEVTAGTSVPRNPSSSICDGNELQSNISRQILIGFVSSCEHPVYLRALTDWTPSEFFWEQLPVFIRGKTTTSLTFLFIPGTDLQLRLTSTWKNYSNPHSRPNLRPDFIHWPPPRPVMLYRSYFVH